MAGYRSVRFTQLFWDTLAEHRHRKEYRHIRAAVADLILRKRHNSGPVNGRDGSFQSDRTLRGIWHLSISRNPDVVLFYVPRDGELVMACLGTHHDYPNGGRYRTSAATTATRVQNAVATTHVPTPGWDAPRWRRPSDLTTHPDLPDLSPAALRGLAWALEEEMGTCDVYRRLHGRDVLDAGEEALGSWLSEAQEAVAAVSAALEARPLTGEEYVDALVAAGPRR